ncbi:hypothetical protein Syun_008122 [Stephania yunnanensis]|uniref:PSII 6.1 kDa protein n=1 Tax=Stephania yunnanensis TaxID=152371 RepID=A0AAP0KZV1_9MAGN
MATITATTPTSSITAARLARKAPTSLSSTPVCTHTLINYVLRAASSGTEGRPSAVLGGEEGAGEKRLGMSASLLAAACAATMSSPAMALVDERLSTEGTGLPFGLSNNLLGWILLGVFALIWASYFVYTSTLEEDEESGLSL